MSDQEEHAAFRAQLLGYADSLDRRVDSVLPLLSVPAKKNNPKRYKVAYKLLEQLISLAKSIIKHTKISSEVKLQAVDENCQAILGSLRMLTESCNKFYYLAIEPETDEELEIRWIYYSLVACVKYRKIMENVASPTPEHEKDKVDLIARIDKSIAKHQKELARCGITKWPPFIALGKGKKGSDRQKRVLDGMTQDDYIKADFDRALALRLNETERRHYQDLGNVAVHSSGFILFLRDEAPKTGVATITGAACLNLWNASRHLALCALEMIDRFPSMEHLIDAQTKVDWQAVARDVKEPEYLFT
jgi:hypothetical protein